MVINSLFYNWWNFSKINLAWESFFYCCGFTGRFSLFSTNPTDWQGEEPIDTSSNGLNVTFYNPFGIIAVFGMNWTLFVALLQLTALNLALQGKRIDCRCCLRGFWSIWIFIIWRCFVRFLLASKNPKMSAFNILICSSVLLITSPILFSLFIGISILPVY